MMRQLLVIANWKINSNQEVVIHKDFSFMADFPAAAYEMVTLQGAYARRKTVRRQQVEQRNLFD